jgi:SAM-dependent MidA family methyltransferase
MSRPAEIIRREIAEHGVLSFARFMEVALYCPDFGYYETKKDSPGRGGDFYTSVSAGELFGQLLAFQFAAWLEHPSCAAPHSSLRLVEAGAHDGRLAADILKWLQAHRPELSAQLVYDIIEPSLHRQEWQKETLKPFAPLVRWFADWENLSRATGHSSLHGVIFSNELLDAMPVHRFGWDARDRKWFEWGVALDGEKFVWARCSGSLAPQSGAMGAFGHPPSSILHLPPSLLNVLPDGYTIETCPASENWWRTATGVLGQGKLVTIDYGLTDDELFLPGRTRGTLRAYFRHHAADDLLANPGEQDLTAHVNFSAIQSVGEAYGLKTESFSTQAQFLTKIVETVFKHPETFGEWGAKQNRQFQTLTHPEHLGRAFRVLVQSR